MTRRPDEADHVEDETRLVAQPPRRSSPDAITAEPVGPVGPVTVCRSCGTANPAGRTLCERCGMGLLSPGDVHVVRERSWAGIGRIAMLVGAVVLGAVVGWLVLRDDAGPGVVAANGSGDDGAGQGASATPDASVAPSEDPPTVELRPGDSGPEVRAWQETLQAAGFDVSADSVFGSETEDATRRFQEATGEEPTGEVTSRTLAAGSRASSLAQVGIFLMRDGDLRRRPRMVDETQLARGAVEALLAAPLDSERDRGLETAIPAGATLDAVVVDDGTAMVRLRGFASDAQAGDLQTRVDQVARTLTRFASIDDVRIVLPDDEAAAFAEAEVALEGLQGQGDG